MNRINDYIKEYNLETFILIIRKETDIALEVKTEYYEILGCLYKFEYSDKQYEQEFTEPAEVLDII